jgi:putative acetyltransferase
VDREALLRRLELQDMARIALVHRSAFDDRLPWLAGRHTPAEDRAYFREVVFADATAWGALVDGEIVGFIALRNGWIDHLYVLPDSQRQGIGTELIALAKQKCAELKLWTYQRNADARAFYTRQGFQIVRETDGRKNESNEPDVLLRWRR